MSASRWSFGGVFGVFLISTFFFFGVSSVQAEDENPTSPFDGVDLSYSSLLVTDTRLDAVEGNPDLVLSAKLQNASTDTRTFGASVEFRRAESESNDASSVRSPEHYTLSAGEERAVSFQVFRPLSLSGTYIPTLVMSDEKGNTVTMTSFAPVELVATEQVAVKNCSFSPSDGDNGILVSDFQRKKSEIVVACEAALVKGKPQTIRMIGRVTGDRVATPLVVGEKTLALSTVAIPARLYVTTEVTPGHYQLEVVMVNEYNQDISTPVRVPLTAVGNGGKILGLGELKRDEAQSTILPIGVAVELADDAEYQLSLVLKSGSTVCADTVTTTIKGQTMVQVPLQVKMNCDMPVVSATLLSGGSMVLDQAEKTVSPITGIVIPMTETPFLDNVLPKLPWIIVAILGVLAGYFIWQKERLRRMAPVWVLALVSVSFVFSVNQVSAANTGFTLFCSDAVQTCPPDGTVWYNFQTNKDVYAPGEVIRITLSISSDDHPVPANNLCPVVQMRINSGSNGPDLVSGCYSANQFTAGVDLSLTQTAPMTTGAFTIGVTVGQNGYMSPASRTMSGLSVAAPTPTASLNISPTVATNPAVITFTLSSTNAQSCEVYETSQPFTYIDKSQNVTGTTVQNTPLPGTYRFQTRCWSGTNGGGSVSVTDIDTLTINPPVQPPTANFTNSPSCTITAGNSGCNVTMSWTSANLTTAVLTNCSDTQIATTGVGPQSVPGVYVPYNSGCYRIHNSTRTGTLLTTGGATSSCAGGTNWNGTVCQASAPVNGVCGSAQGKTYNVDDSIIPTGNRCSTGTYDVVQWGSDGGAWYTPQDTFNGNGIRTPGTDAAYYMGRYWECDGAGGGVTRGCLLYYEPQCGSAAGRTFSSPPPANTANEKRALCDIGTATVVQTNPTTYTWSCNSGAGPTDNCSATRSGGGSPTARITARVVVASNDASWWQKLISFVTGRDHTAQATGPDANITTNGTAAIDWSASGTGSCLTFGPGMPTRNDLSGSQNLSGATLGAGTYTYTTSCSGAPVDTVNVVVTAAGPSGPGTPGSGPGGFFNATPAACGTGTINISWNSTSGATGYQVRDGSTNIYSGPSTSYSHTGLVAGSAHSYTVRATSPSGNSAWSSVRNANAPNTCAGGPSATLSASPANIAAPGNPSTLTWTTSGSVTSCWATGGTDGTWNNTWKNERGGTQVVTPSVTTTYTIECWDASGTSTGVKPATVTIGNGFVCTGSMSNHATVYSGDSTGLSANTPYSYSATNTAPKCQYSCDAGYTWDGTQCAGPSVSLTASPTTITSGNSSTLTWTPSSDVTSCWATNGTSPWTNSSRNASGGTQAVSPTTTTTYSIECWNATGISTGIRNRTITVTGGGPAAAVNLCPGSATLGVGSTQQFAAYYTAAGVTWNGCGSPNGTNVTSSGSTTWSTSNATVATMNNGSSKGLSTGVASGSATMSAVYSGLTGNATVTISCTPTNSCSSASSDTRATGICAGDTFTITDGCGGTLTCSGTRVCDYNWKEVAP